MGKRVIEETFCDRCGVVLTGRPYYGESGTYKIVATSDFAVEGQTDFEWRELCPNCNTYVGNLISRIKGENIKDTPNG